MWEFDKNQIYEGGMLIDTETGRAKGTLVEEESRAKNQKLGIKCIGRGGI